jgi:superfamily II DNA/RNA helicase
LTIFFRKIDIDESKSKKTIEFYLEMEEKLKDPSTQLVFASATIPLQLQTTLEGLIDWQTQLKTIKTTRINRLMLHVPQKFIRTNGTKKPSQLLEIVQKDLKNKNSAMMVFCYKSKTATYISKYLMENDIEGVELLTKKLSNR